MRRLGRLLPAFALLAAPLLAGAAIGIVDATVKSESTHTRVVLSSMERLQFSLASLRNPDRVVLEMDGIQGESLQRALAGKLKALSPFIRAARVSAGTGSRVRLELELNEEAEAAAFTKEGAPSHLVLDLYRGPVPPEVPPLAAVSAQPLLSPSRTGPPLKEPRTREALLAVHLNDLPPFEPVIVLREPEGLLLRAEDVRRWRLRLPQSAIVTRDGEERVVLDRLSGTRYRVDEPSQALLIEATASAFEATMLSGRSGAIVVPAPSPPGAFANYDAFMNRSEGETVTSGQLEIGAFGPWGVATSSVVAHSAGQGKRVARLETTWTIDRPERLESVRIGDSISASASWGRSVRFGGVQWATNFATQPGLITFPLPALAGEAVLPSIVDLYVNDALRLRREVPPGPFSIQDLPVLTGRGEMRLVVRDLLGRQSVVVQPFYASGRLLQRGLHEFSYEAGAVRNSFGLESNDYRRGMVVATHRFGFTDHITGEIHGEALREQQTAGVGGAFLHNDIGLFSVAAAASRDRDGRRGALAAFGFERQSQLMSVGVNVQAASSDFVQLGLQPGERAPRSVSRAFASFAPSSSGSFALSYARQDYRDRPDINLVNGTYSASLGTWGFLNISVLRFLGEDAKTVFAINFTYPLGPRTSASAGVTAENGRQQSLVQMQRSLPAGSGWGYRVLAGGGETERLEAGLSAQTDYGTYSAEAGLANGRSAFRAGASGGIAYLGGRAFASRRIDESFAVLRLPEFENVRVYLANQVVAQTDGSGIALVPRLLPYQKNLLRIDQADLPLDVEVSALELEMVPWYRSGTLARFDVRRSRGATFTIRLEDGGPMPAGALVTLDTGAEAFPVGLRGEVYVTGLRARNLVAASWRERSCTLEILFEGTTDPLPHLGEYICKGVTR